MNCLENSCLNAVYVTFKDLKCIANFFVSVYDREILEEEREQEASMMKHEKRKHAATWGFNPDEPPPKVSQIVVFAFSQ